MKRRSAVKAIGALVGSLSLVSFTEEKEYPFVYDVRIPHTSNLEDPDEYKLIMNASYIGNGGDFDHTNAYMVTQSIDKVHYDDTEPVKPHVIRHRVKYWVNVKVYSKIPLNGQTLGYCSEYGVGLKRVAYLGFIWGGKNAYWKNHTSEIIA